MGWIGGEKLTANLSKCHLVCLLCVDQKLKSQKILWEPILYYESLHMSFLVPGPVPMHS